MNAEAPRDNLRGGAWMIADLSLNVWALSIVKALGLGYPAAQLVFLRALVGLLVISPVIWRQRHRFRGVQDLPLHGLRVGLSVITLTASFYAIARVPIALFTAMNFTRPLVTMLLAALLLREVIPGRVWAAAGVALLGVVLAINPGTTPLSPGLMALGVVILSGSGAIIVTRRLRAAPQIVLMTFYTAGLALFTLPFALVGWTAVAPGHLLPLLAVGAFSQAAQMCFLKAHFHGQAGFLSVLSYTGLILSVSVGWLIFDERPDLSFWIGASIVIAAAAYVTLSETRKRAS